MRKKEGGKPQGKAERPNYTARKEVTIGVTSDDVDEIGRKYAAHFTSGGFAALRVILASEKSARLDADLDLPGLLATLREQAEAVNAGSLAQAEAMLVNQATALQSLFARLAERGMGHDSIPGFDANMRMALRAQSQCRATLETLAMIKNPPIVYAKQANVTTGPQQVNNGLAAPRTRETETEQSQLLRADHVERLDTGTTGAAGRGDQALEAVGAVHGAKDGRG